jgi:hypothetical protein
VNSEISQILAQHSANAAHGTVFAVPFSAAEQLIIDRWLAWQRTANEPDAEIWNRLLLGRKPAFKYETEKLLTAKWADTIRCCASPLDLNDVTDVEKEFPILGNLGIHYLLSGVDSTKTGIYGSTEPILVDRMNVPIVWKVETKDKDSITVKEASLEDIPTVLLREWKLLLPRFKKARERLCDILSKCRYMGT